MSGYVRKTITIKDYQDEWLRRNHINFSRWVQAKLDEEIKKGGKNDGKKG